MKASASPPEFPSPCDLAGAKNSLQRKLCGEGKSGEQLALNQRVAERAGKSGKIFNLYSPPYMYGEKSASPDPLATSPAARSTGDLPRVAQAEDTGPWQRFLDEYTESLRVGGYAKRTIELYPRYAARFAAWLIGEGIIVPTEIRPETCAAFQRAVYYYHPRSGQPNPVTSQSSLLTTVRSFTRFLKRAGYALIDAGLAIQMPRLPKRLPRDIISEEEMTRLLSMPDTRTIRGYRDRTILEMLYGTGMRSAELFALDVEDVDVSSGRVHIRQGKGGKDRVVPMGEVAAEYAGGYLARIRPRLGASSKARGFLLTSKGMRMDRRPVTAMVRRYAKKAGIERRIGLHTFRHTCATHMLRRGANIRHVQEQLGHESIATTERYTRVEIGDLAEVHEKFHPRKTL